LETQITNILLFDGHNKDRDRSWMWQINGYSNWHTTWQQRQQE